MSVAGEMAAREAALLCFWITSLLKLDWSGKNPLVSVIRWCKKTTDSVEMKDLEQTSALSTPFLAELGSNKLIILYKPGFN